MSVTPQPDVRLIDAPHPPTKRIWNHQALAGENKAASATALGLGARFTAIDQISGAIEVAKPLTRNVAAEGDR
ncbi:MAG: hypothetical protein HY060_17365, partial [Proteobacteria bacterium]|nr:hypothetical protein [Pseudomonadota bacterium]